MRIFFTLLATAMFAALCPLTIDAQCIGTEPLISQVIEGSASNKAVEIYNPSGAALDLSLYELVRVANGNGYAGGTTIALSGSLAAGEVFIIANGGSAPDILAIADATSGTISHNGNDSYVLRLVAGEVIVDSYGDTDNSSTFGANMSMQRVLDGSACPYDLDPADDFVSADYLSEPYSAGIPEGLGQGALPVVLQDFSVFAISDKIHVTWTTASELANSHFEVLYSEHGVDFRNIGTVDGAGYSNEELNYSFIHENVSTGMHYYRLKQVDFDSKFEVFGIKSVEIRESNNISIYPTATYTTLNIEGLGEGSEVQILTMNGSEVFNQVVDGKSIDVSDFASGSYILRIGKTVLQFVKL